MRNFESKLVKISILLTDHNASCLIAFRISYNLSLKIPILFLYYHLRFCFNRWKVSGIVPKYDFMLSSGRLFLVVLANWRIAIRKKKKKHCEGFWQCLALWFNLQVIKVKAACCMGAFCLQVSSLRIRTFCSRSANIFLTPRPVNAGGPQGASSFPTPRSVKADGTRLQIGQAPGFINLIFQIVRFSTYIIGYLCGRHYCDGSWRGLPYHARASATTYSQIVIVFTKWRIKINPVKT